MRATGGAHRKEPEQYKKEDPPPAASGSRLCSARVGRNGHRPHGFVKGSPLDALFGGVDHYGALEPALRIGDMSILLSDVRVRTIPLRDNGEPLVSLTFAPAVLVRAGLADRLHQARDALPRGVDLRIVEGHRSIDDQQAIIDRYTGELRVLHPDADEAELTRLSSRFVAPMAVAPHVAGAAVDLTLVDDSGRELWMGTPVDATPEQSNGKCWFDADVGPIARPHRDILARALTDAGLVNYPTEWWHWSFGDRYWALTTGARHAIYGPVEAEVAAEVAAAG